MTSTDYTTYSPAVAQHGYNASASQQAQGYTDHTGIWMTKLWNLGIAYMSAIPRLRPLTPMTDYIYNFLWAASYWYQAYSHLSRGVTLVLMIPPRLQSPPLRPPMQSSLHMAVAYKKQTTDTTP